MEKIKLGHWLQESITRLTNGDKLCDIHIDNLLGYNCKTKKEIMEFSLQVFKQGINLIDVGIENVQFEIQIRLDSYTSKILGVPKSKTELCNSIDMYGVPELLLFRPLKNPNITLIESYSSPVPFQMLEPEMQNCYTRYDEYRTVEEMNNDEEFVRWFSLIYLKL